MFQHPFPEGNITATWPLWECDILQFHNGYSAIFIKYEMWLKQNEFKIPPGSNAPLQSIQLPDSGSTVVGQEEGLG